MPTGYTSKIYDRKDITVQEFISDCAKAFGAYIMARDLPNDQKPDVFEPSTHYIDRARMWEQSLEELLSMTEDEAQQKADEEYNSAIKSREESIANKKAIRQRYESMLEKVKAWTPPTDDHVNLKEFCIQQLTDSIKFDCDTSYYENHKIERLTGREWLNNCIDYAKITIEQCLRDHEEEVQRTNRRNKWIADLKESLAELE